MKTIVESLRCPSCRGPLVPKMLGCDACGIEVRGPFALNEFATLDVDDLRLLRIFVLAEGRIRDMEAPLGLSYPTIRTRLAQLREKLAPDASAPLRNSVPAPTKMTPGDHVDATLERLKAGEVSFEEALESIRNRPKTRSKKDQK